MRWDSGFTLIFMAQNGLRSQTGREMYEWGLPQYAQ